jgi:hypothetical protein
MYPRNLFEQGILDKRRHGTMKFIHQLAAQQISKGVTIETKYLGR